MIRFPRITAAKRMKALEEAEEAFARADKKRGKQKVVQLRTSEIQERLELFQPREFNYGARSLNPEWVKGLAKRMSIQGELDPVLVIRLGQQWVCVDGHHRIAAYRLRNHKKQIKCEWFAGTPKEAVDESVRRNIKDALAVPQADRAEEAWRRVLLGQGSRKEISKTCGVGPSLVSEMRRVKRRYENDPAFAERVGRPLMETSWGIMKLARRGDGPGDEAADLDEQAEALARAINGRLTDQLKTNPLVTALALAKYDARLPKRLMDVWQGLMPVPGTQRAPLTTQEMRRQAVVLRNRGDLIEAEAARRDERAKKAFVVEARKREAKAEAREREAWRLAWEKMTPEEREKEENEAFKEF